MLAPMLLLLLLARPPRPGAWKERVEWHGQKVEYCAPLDLAPDSGQGERSGQRSAQVGGSGRPVYD